MGILLVETLEILIRCLKSFRYDLRRSNLERQKDGTAICFRVIGSLFALKTDLTTNRIPTIRSNSLSLCLCLFTSPASDSLFTRENADVWSDTAFLTILAQTWKSQSDWLDRFGRLTDRDLLTIITLVFTRSLRNRVQHAYQIFRQEDMFHIVRELSLYSSGRLGRG